MAVVGLGRNDRLVSIAWFARAPYTAKTRPRGCAENRRAAALGGLKLASAATYPPALFAWPQKPLILLDRNCHPNRIEHGARPQFKCALVGANEAIAENHEKKARGSAFYAQKENSRPRVGTCPESAMVHGNEADEIRISHSNTRALSFVCKIVELSTCRRA